MEKVSLLQKKKYFMSQGEARLYQHQRERRKLPLTEGEVSLVQVPQTKALDQVPHS